MLATICSQARADKRKDLARTRKEKEKGKRTRRFLQDFVLLIIVTVNAKTEQVVHILTNLYRRQTTRPSRVPVAVLRGRPARPKELGAPHLLVTVSEVRAKGNLAGSG